MPNSITYLNWTPICELHVWLQEQEHITNRSVLRKVGLCCVQNYDYYSKLNNQHKVGEYITI
jgi:hypothetical protein